MGRPSGSHAKASAGSARTVVTAPLFPVRPEPVEGPKVTSICRSSRDSQKGLRQAQPERRGGSTRTEGRLNPNGGEAQPERRGSSTRTEGSSVRTEGSSVRTESISPFALSLSKGPCHFSLSKLRRLAERASTGPNGGKQGGRTASRLPGFTAQPLHAARPPCPSVGFGRACGPSHREYRCEPHPRTDTARAAARRAYSPAAAFKAAALSVRSQLNSGSSRPKWP